MKDQKETHKTSRFTTLLLFGIVILSIVLLFMVVASQSEQNSRKIDKYIIGLQNQIDSLTRISLKLSVKQHMLNTQIQSLTQKSDTIIIQINNHQKK